MSNKPVTKGPKPKMYRKTKATKPVNPLFERILDLRKFPLVGGFLAKKWSF